MIVGFLLLPVRARADLILAGEPVRLDSDFTIHFTKKQLAQASASIREGFVKWASTEQGKRLLRHFNTAEYQVVVREDLDEPGIGRAPEPGMIAFVTASDRTKVKVYELILNPTPWKLPLGTTALPNEPSSAADLLAAAWAAEMLHIDLYSKGVRLPHHARPEFQEAWRTVANELGFPAMTHGNDDRPRWREGAYRR
jgi:hypothetical protein